MRRFSEARRREPLGLRNGNFIHYALRIHTTSISAAIAMRMCHMPGPGATDDVAEISAVRAPAEHARGAVGPRDEFRWISRASGPSNGLDWSTRNLPCRLDNLKH